MGSKYTVMGWMFGDPHKFGRDDWQYVEVYSGQSLLKALWLALINTRNYGCVKLELR